jgi:hypothetical protein
MYTLRGADQQEHGPLSTRDVRDWIAAGRATRETLARADQEETWRPLSEFVEFQAAFQIIDNKSSPPPLPEKPPNRIMALIALVLSFIPVLTTLPAAILAIISLVLAKKKPAQFGGKRMATVALIICALWAVFIPSMAYYGFTKMRRQMYNGNNCYVHARSLTSSLRVISIANNGAYPDADSWCDAIGKEVTSKEHYQCPDDPKHGECGFAYNAKLSGVKNPNPNTVMIFESDLGWNGAGGISNVITTPRHHGQITVGFAGGGVRGVRTNELRSLRWEP